MKIVFSRHAQEKFQVLARHGLYIERHMVVDAVQKPAHLDYSRAPLVIAQIPLDRTHVFRVVYKQEGNQILVITFYPGRIKQYGK